MLVKFVIMHTNVLYCVNSLNVKILYKGPFILRNYIFGIYDSLVLRILYQCIFFIIIY